MDSLKPVLKYVPFAGAALSAIAVVSVFIFNWFGMEGESETLWNWTNMEGNRDLLVLLILACALVSAIVAGAAYFMKDKMKLLSISSGAASLLGALLAFVYYFDQKGDLDDLFESFGDLGMDMPSLEIKLGFMIFVLSLILSAVVLNVAAFMPKEEKAMPAMEE
jgi:hypothetical protein